MFEERYLVGISMAPRAHRRALVVLTYAVSLFLIVGSWFAVLFGRGFLRAHLVLGLATMTLMFPAWFVLLLAISRSIFGRFVPSGFRRSIVGPPSRPVQTGLGLAASAPEDEPAPDEREVVLRDHAYYLAYKGLVISAFTLLPALLICMELLPSRAATATGTCVSFLFLLLAVTLPQAVILWTEPDLDIG